MQKIIHLGTVNSVLDVARLPKYADKLVSFDSLLAVCQTEGRGQYRRKWLSPEGNIYAALRLPMAQPFLGTEAAVVLGAYVVDALVSIGYPAFVKWPNDVILAYDEQYYKVCGILLEERDGLLLAGIGVNVSATPYDKKLDGKDSLRAGCLKNCAASHGLNIPNRDEVWNVLVKHIYSSYNLETVCNRRWLAIANRRLLWRDKAVTLMDGESMTGGLLRGIGSKGELVLELSGVSSTFLSGSIRLCG